MTTLKLYEIANELYALQAMLEDDGGELTEEHEQLEDLIRRALTEKTDGCVHLIQSIDDDIESAKKRIEELGKFVESRKNTKERFSLYVLNCLKKMNTNKIKGELYEIKRRAAMKVVDITDENEIPPQYIEVITSTRICKKEIASAIKSGEVVKGAQLIDGKEGISFKTKTSN